MAVADTITTFATRPRVLVVDHAIEALNEMRAVIRDAQMECLSCSTSQAAVNFLQRESVDLIIADLLMPDVNGFELCRFIKQQEHLRHIPVLLHGYNMTPEEKSQGLRVGAFDYLAKPIELQDFSVRAHAALCYKALHDELARQAVLDQQIKNFQQGMLTTHWQKRFSQLATSFVSEINQPLNAAQSGVQLLTVAEGLRDELRERLQLVDLDLRRVTGKLRRLQLVGQPTSGQQVVYLASLIENLTTLAYGALSSHDIALSLDLDPTCEWRGMPSELGRAFLYLFYNAIEAVAEQPDPAITVQLEKDESRQLISITDNGPGISEENLAKVFQPFFTTKGPPHTGAGLYLAHTIIKAANGTIDVVSPAPHGATAFIITLPQNTLPPAA